MDKSNTIKSKEDTNLEIITQKIFIIRGQKVILDKDLAELYEVSIKRLNEQVKRNIDRFPDDFMIQLSEEEYRNLRSQILNMEEGATYPMLLQNMV